MSYYLLVAGKSPLKTLAAGHDGGWVIFGLSLFGSNIALDMASTTVISAVRVSWTYEKTDIPTLAIPEASSCSSGTLLLLPYWPDMHRVSARNDLGCTQLHTYSRWPLESLRVLSFLPPVSRWLSTVNRASRA